ncbi:MAG: alpha-glucosidase [archaeon]|nr:alpha-glucosidase [archaeon]
MPDNLIVIQKNIHTNGFDLKFKGRQIIHHDSNNPCVFLGHHEPNIQMQARYVGFYKKIKTKVTQINSLNQVEIVEITQNESYILKFGKEFEIGVKIIDNRLVLEPKLLPESAEQWTHFSLKLSANSNEAIYGGGEQFSFLNLRGRNLPLWTQEPGFVKKRKSVLKYILDAVIGAGGEWWTTYYPQPTFMSSDNYFVHIESYALGELDFRNKNYHQIRFNEIPGKIIIDVQESAIKTLTSMTEYLGRQRPLPDWTLDGLWLGIIGGLGGESDSNSIQAKLAKAKGANTKVAAIWAEDWSGIREFPAQTRLFWNWKYSKELYKGLPNYIEELHAEGIRFLGYNNCFLMKDGDMYKEAEEKGYLVKKQNGDIYDLPMHSFSAPILDLTNPKTWEWFKELIKEHMIGIGLDGWMCDFAEYIPIDGVFHDGSDPYKYHNEYPVLWAKVNAEAVKEMGRDTGDDAIVFFSRSGNYGTTKFSPLIWAGDQVMRFWLEMGLASQIIAAVSLGFCGVGFTHADIAGEMALPYISQRTKEYFMRGTELCAFTTVMRTHESKGHSGWSWYSDQETLDHFAKFSRVHAHLKPYLKDAIQEYSEIGIPIVRHPYLHYENDPTFHKQKPRIIQYEYLLGRDLLVAPVIDKGAKKRKLYLPNDNWVHVWTGREYQGGWITVEAPLWKPPVFYRKGTTYLDLFEKLKNA